MIIKRYLREVPQYKRVEFASGGFGSEKIASRIITIEVVFNDEQIASHLARRVAQSVRGKSSYMGGCVRARIVREGK